MKKAIRSWGKYVPWPVVQLLLRKDAMTDVEMTVREVSIFFSDIANFTTIVESLPPDRSLLLLSRYFHDMSKVIDEHGGIVLEFIGDAILCIYGAPVVNEAHPTAAVKAAVRMLGALRRINHWCRVNELPEVNIRCGVHSGTVLVGNIGFQHRIKYGVIGENADYPGKLEEMNKHYSTKLLISEETYERLDPQHFWIRPIDFVHHGGLSVTVYEVAEKDIRQNAAAVKSSAAMAYRTALQAYRQAEFAEALDGFQKADNIFEDLVGKEDLPSKMMIARCKAYLADPPPTSWDGVWDR